MTAARPSPFAFDPQAAAHSRRRRLWRRLLLTACLLIVFTFVYLVFLWPWMRDWGATAEETALTLTGDDLVAASNIRLTKGITVRAAPAEIYPWLLQIGVDRGGMYSYDWLENLAGLNVHTTTTIEPQWQDVQTGDFWRFTPADYFLNPGPGLYVHQLEQDQAVVLCFGMENKRDEACIDSWQFVLRPQPDGTTRLLLRSNMAIEPVLPIKLTYFIQFIMERKMLLTLRERAEANALKNSS